MYPPGADETGRLAGSQGSRIRPLRARARQENSPDLRNTGHVQFAPVPRMDRQDVLWKINIPTRERRAALRRLDRHNINAYSLFTSEEGLMRALAFRVMEQFIERGILDEPTVTI